VWFGNEGDGILPAEHTFTGATAERSLAKLRDLLIRESSIEVIAIGPLTNIAELVTACPDVTARIARLTIMGGMTEEGATPLPSCFDYNLWADPISTAQVFGSGVPIRLVPIELTMRAILSVTDLEQLAATDHPLCGALGKATRDWTPILHLIFQGFGLRLNGDVAAFLHDVIALYSACHPEYCRFADRYVVPRVSTDKVLLEPVAQHDHGSVNVEYMTHLNWSGLKEHFMNTLRSLHGRAVAPGVSDIAGGDVLGYPSTMIVSPAPIQPPPPPGLHRIDDLSPFAI
jgi:inosine-uridine nucleoside N-ribohydrolase